MEKKKTLQKNNAKLILLWQAKDARLSRTESKMAKGTTPTPQDVNFHYLTSLTHL